MLKRGPQKQRLGQIFASGSLVGHHCDRGCKIGTNAEGAIGDFSYGDKVDETGVGGTTMAADGRRNHGF